MFSLNDIDLPTVVGIKLGLNDYLEKYIIDEDNLVLNSKDIELFAENFYSSKF